MLNNFEFNQVQIDAYFLRAYFAQFGDETVLLDEVLVSAKSRTIDCQPMDLVNVRKIVEQMQV